jgi:hypothetical protein
VIEGKTAVSRRAAARSGNEREGVDWAKVIMSRSAAILYPNFPRRQSPISIRPIRSVKVRWRRHPIGRRLLQIRFPR